MLRKVSSLVKASPERIRAARKAQWDLSIQTPSPYHFITAICTSQSRSKQVSLAPWLSLKVLQVCTLWMILFVLMECLLWKLDAADLSTVT